MNHFCEKEVEIAVHRINYDQHQRGPTIHLIRLIKGLDIFMVFPFYLDLDDAEYHDVLVCDELVKAAKKLMKNSSGKFDGDSNMCWVLFFSIKEASELHHSLVQLFETYQQDKEAA